MADDGRPGWWMASDGQWYPPEEHPDPEHRSRYPSAPPAAEPTAETGAVPPPLPPTVPAAPIPPAAPVAPATPPPGPKAIEPKERPPRAGRAVGIAVAAVLVVGAGVGAFLVSGGGDDDDEASTDRTTTTADQDDDDRDETTTTEADDEETTTTTEAEVVEPPFDAATVEVADPLPFTFQVPDDFVVVLTSPTPQTGAELAPNDPDLAAAIDRIVAGLPGSVALVIDPAFDPLAEQPPLIIAVAVQTPEDGIDAAGQAALNLADYQAGGITTDGEVEEVDDSTAVLRFTATGGSVNHQIFRSLGSSVVVFAAIGLDADEFAPVADAVAATLVAG